MLNPAEHATSNAQQTSKLSDIVFITLINVKIPTTVDILTF